MNYFKFHGLLAEELKKQNIMTEDQIKMISQYRKKQILDIKFRSN